MFLQDAQGHFKYLLKLLIETYPFQLDKIAVKYLKKASGLCIRNIYTVNLMKCSVCLPARPCIISSAEWGTPVNYVKVLFRHRICWVRIALFPHWLESLRHAWIAPESIIYAYRHTDIGMSLQLRQTDERLQESLPKETLYHQILQPPYAVMRCLYGNETAILLAVIISQCLLE